MNLEHRIQLLVQLGQYISSGDPDLAAARERAGRENAWFVPDFVDAAMTHIAENWLQPGTLRSFTGKYPETATESLPIQTGLVMAGNIPLVGFHDFMCAFLAGHQVVIKPSSKDKVLVYALVEAMQEWAPELKTTIRFAEQLKGCDAYIATGSNNSSRYFEYYFRKYAHIIRKNRSSAAILTGNETPEQLEGLADDLLFYFGLGCRNVSKLYVPVEYDFRPLLEALNKYDWMKDHAKFRNNYDYRLALHMLNNQYYMSNGTVLLVEHQELFSPISEIHYEYYETLDAAQLSDRLGDQLQCLCGTDEVPFGSAQSPAIDQFADGVDTMAFLTKLKP